MASQLPAPRSSSSSGKSQSSRSVVPDKQISQIEKSVTHLLVATKQLLETLTQWSRKQASENEVSDVYVRLGYEFNLACRAFNAIGVDTADLGPVPDLLRSILEDTLSQDASPQSLDRYLPRIRDIIINLLHGLKKKQARLRSRQQREEGKSSVGRQTSSGSVPSTSAATSQTSLDGTASSVTSPKRPPDRRFGSNGSLEDPSVLPRKSSASSGSDGRTGAFVDRDALRREAQHILSHGSRRDADTTTSVQATTSGPFVPAYPTPPPPPPPPAPKEDDALGALQRSGELERRASRRFSAYQIQKHLGASTAGVPVLPTQTSPLPNRGRDVRESLNAVRLRGSYVPGRSKVPSRSQDVSPSKGVAAQTQPPIRAPAEDEVGGGQGPATAAVEPPGRSSPTKVNTTTATTTTAHPHHENRHLHHSPSKAPQVDFPHPPDASVLAEPFEPVKGPAAEISPGSVAGSVPAPGTPQRELSAAASTPPQSEQFSPEQPSPGKELTLFLQYKSKIKKYILPDGAAGLTIGRIQLAFIEKFAWNTHNNGVDLPEIYIQDPVSGVRHELEDLNDVKDRCVLALNVDSLDEVKRHVEEGFSGMRRMIESLKATLDGQESVIQSVSQRQLDAAKEIARLAATPPVAVPSLTTVMSPKAGNQAQPASITGTANQMAELQSLRRDLAVLRQTYTNFTADVATSMNLVRSKASSVKSAAVDVSVPSFEGDAGRARVNAGKKELADESERLVARVDDLQDLVEDLRKDVVTRGVRPLPRQLEAVSKDISAVSKEIKKMKDFLKREKPVWTKIWEKELQLVCEERDQLTMQEDLAADLDDDLEKAAQTFALVEQATKQQSMQNEAGTSGVGGGSVGIGLRNVSRGLMIDPAIDPVKAKDGVLGEVRALQPNHESRLEAIERAERARQKELESRRVGPFLKELGSFVQEGKLKKSGGVEEAERLRRAKDDRIRKEVWERQLARAAELEKAAAEAAAAADTGDAATGTVADGDADVEAEKKADVDINVDPERDLQPGGVGSGTADAHPSAEDFEAVGAGKQPESSSPVTHDDSKEESSVRPPKRTSWLPAIFSGSA